MGNLFPSSICQLSSLWTVENDPQFNHLIFCCRDGQPIPIEYLPAEHTLDSRVRLLVEYKGRATSTIAVGDELTFKLETQTGENLLQVTKHHLLMSQKVWVSQAGPLQWLICSQKT